MAAGWRVLVGLTLLAGCVEQGHISSGPFSVDVPTWKAGHSWTYAVDQKMTERLAGSRSSPPAAAPEESSTRTTIEVVNTTHRIDTGPVYYAWYDERPNPDVVPVGSSRNAWRDPSDVRLLHAYRQSDLSLAALGVVVPVESRCHTACNVLRPAGPADLLPTFEFPLEPGKTWTRSGSPSDDVRMEYTYEVVGRRAGEDARAGMESAVLVHVQGQLLVGVELLKQNLLRQFAPNNAKIDTSELEFRFGADYYWGEAEKNLIFAHQSTHVLLHLRGAETDGRPYWLDVDQSAEETRRLDSVSLESRAETRLPALSIQGLKDPDLERVSRLWIRTDLDGETRNVAGGPVEVNAWVTDDAQQPARPLHAPYNASRFVVAWQVGRVGSEIPQAQGEGPAWSVAVARAGSYTITAVVTDRLFDAEVARPVSSLRFFYQAAAYLRLDSGASEMVRVLSFPVEGTDATVTFQWRTHGAPALDQSADLGSMHLVDPSGRTAFSSPNYPTGGQRTSGVTQAGTYELWWNPTAPVRAGDDVEAQVLVTYPDHHLHDHLW